MRTGKNGYTKAVDMWSLGGVAVTLLSGTPLFVDSKDDNFKTNPDEVIARLAAECNQAQLNQSKDWQHVGERAKDFVRKLLVLDETKRMTVNEALEHPWFTNEHHKNEFEAVYLRAIRHWTPRPQKPDIIELLDVNRAEEGPIPKRKRLTSLSQPSSKRALLPIEPPYIPFHRHISKLDPPGRESESLAASINFPLAPWKAQVGWIRSLHDAALLQDKSIRTDLASVSLRWPTASTPETLKRKLGSSLRTPRALDASTAFSPGTDVNSIARSLTGFETDVEDEVMLVPTSSPG